MLYTVPIIRFSFILAGLFFFPALHAQRDSLVLSDEIRKLNGLWNSYQKEIEYPQWQENFDQVEKLLRLRSARLNQYEYENEIHRRQANMLHSDPGLSANASYLENFTPSFNEDDDNLIYQRRLQAGLTWDLLGSGFLENRSNEEIHRNTILINSFLAPSEAKENSYSLNWNLIIYIFNREKIEILNERSTLVEEMADDAERLHLARYLSREDYLRVLSRKAEVEALQRIYEDFNVQFGHSADSLGINASDLPLLDIRYTNVFSDLDSGSRDSISQLYLENLRLEHRFINDVRLNTALRYNYYDLVVPGNRSFFTLGVNLSLPLPLQLRQRSELADAKAAQSMYLLQQKFEGKQKEMLNECYEYRYKLKQYIGFHQKFLLYEELLRKMNATLRLDPVRFNPVEGLALLDDMLAVKMELIDIRQSLYLKLLRIYTKTGKKNPQEIASLFSIPNYFDLDAVTERSAYVWSSLFSKKEVSFISEYLLYNKFDKAVVSLNSDDNYRKKLKELMLSPAVQKLSFEAMLGDNNLIRHPLQPRLDELFSGFTDSSFTSLHLDVEPHTFADWQEKKAAYLQQYMKMLQEAKNYCDSKGMQLSVSIPLHYPEETVNAIFELCDQVYFMAYENIKPEYVEKKLSPYYKYKNKMVIAIRTKDFGSRIAMEKYLIDFYHRSGIDRFALHDAGGLIEMDEKTMQR